jgi:hypothetical protein
MVRAIHEDVCPSRGHRFKPSSTPRSKKPTAAQFPPRRRASTYHWPKQLASANHFCIGRICCGPSPSSCLTDKRGGGRRSAFRRARRHDFQGNTYASVSITVHPKTDDRSRFCPELRTMRVPLGSSATECVFWPASKVMMRTLRAVTVLSLHAVWRPIPGSALPHHRGLCRVRSRVDETFNTNIWLSRYIRLATKCSCIGT